MKKKLYLHSLNCNLKSVIAIDKIGQLGQIAVDQDCPPPVALPLQMPAMAIRDPIDRILGKFQVPFGAIYADLAHELYLAAMTAPAGGK